jgi:hypothetical protein
MSSLGNGVRIVGRAVLQLDQTVTADCGPDPRQLRAIVGLLYDAAGYLMQAANDLEAGIES